MEPKASQDAIKKAYKEMTKKAQSNKERLAELKEAFDVLSDPKKRAEYDKQASSPSHEEEEEDDGMQNLFDILRGGRGGQSAPKPEKKRKMKPLQFALDVTLDDIYAGTTSKMRVTRMRLCKACGGKGCKPGAYSATCQTCEGRKFVMKVVQVGPGMYAQSRAPCDDCHGINVCEIVVQ